MTIYFFLFVAGAALPDTLIATIDVQRVYWLSSAACRGMNVGALPIDTWAQISNASCARTANISLLDNARISALSNETCQIIHAGLSTVNQLSAFSDGCIAHWRNCRKISGGVVDQMSVAKFSLLDEDCIFDFDSDVFPYLNYSKVAYIMSVDPRLCSTWKADKLAALPLPSYGALTARCVRAWGSSFSSPCSGFPDQAALYFDTSVFGNFSADCLEAASTAFIANIPAAGAALFNGETFRNQYYILKFMSIPALQALSLGSLAEMNREGWIGLNEYVSDRSVPSAAM